MPQSALAADARPDEIAMLLTLDEKADRLYSTRNFNESLPVAQEALELSKKAFGLNHSQTASAAYMVARIYKAMHDYAKAEAFFQHSLQINEKALGPMDPQVASELNNLAELYRSTEAYAKAESLYQRALTIRETALGPDDEDVATILSNLASLYYSTGELAKAERLYERALKILEKALGPHHPKVATELNNLAELCKKMGAYEKAEPLYKRVAEMVERALGPESEVTATALANLAGLYRTQAQYEKALPLLQRLLSIHEKGRGSHDQETVVTLNDLAELYKATGEYAKAEPLFQRALKICEERQDSGSPEMDMVLNNLAHLHFLKSDFAKSEELYQRALQSKAKRFGPDNPNTAITLNDLAQVHDRLGDYAKAEALYERALRIAEKVLGADHLHTSTYRLNLAQTYFDVGEYTKAWPLYQRALQINEKKFGPDHPQTASALIGVAEIHLLLGDRAAAESLFRRALQIREKALGLNHPDTARSLTFLAGLYRSKGDDSQAERLYQRALGISEKTIGPDHPLTGGILEKLAVLKMTLGDTKGALPLFTRARSVEENTLSNILSFTSEQQRLIFQKTVDPYSLLANLSNVPALAQAVLRRKGIVLDSLLEDRLVAEGSKDPKQKDTIDRLRAKKQHFMQLQLEAPKDVSAAAQKQRAEEKENLFREIEQLEAGLARQVAGLGKTRRALSVTVGQVQSVLPPHAILVELLQYHQYRKGKVSELRYGAIIIAATGSPKWVPLASAAEIKKEVSLYQKSARGETDQATLSAVLKRFTEQVWAPIEKEFQPGTRTVIISPEADLNFVSFATLLTSDDKFQSENYTIRYVASGRDLLKKAKGPGGQQSTVRVFANPTFAATASATREEVGNAVALRPSEIRSLQSLSLPDLPGTENESAQLQVLAKKTGWDAQVTLGTSATEAKLREIRSPRILHLATHGFFLPEPEPEAIPLPGMQSMVEAPRGKLINPMHRSGFALAGAQTTLQAWAKGEVPFTENDGIVTAEEAGGLKLDGTWLVVLSACDTASGEVKAGEGVMGLRRGFAQAGGENLLMTLWPISDEMTVRIMLDFYKAAFKSGDAPQALADTQRDWLVKLRHEKSLLNAVRLAGPFILSSQGK